MTVDKWLACTDSVPMLEYAIGRLPARKVRLFACGLCRRFWDLLQDKRSRKAVVVAERFADGLATERDRRAAETAAETGSRRLYKEADPTMDEGSEASLVLRAAYLATHVTREEPFGVRTTAGSYYLLDRFAVVTPYSPRTCVACWGRVRHFATLSAVRNCPLLAPRPEIIPQRANLPGVSGFSARLPQSASSGDFGTPPDDQKKVTNNRQPVLLPAGQQVEHPATTDVRPGAAAVR